MLLKAAGLMTYSQNTPQSSFKASLSEKPLKTSLCESPGVLQVIPLSALFPLKSTKNIFKFPFNLLPLQIKVHIPSI